MKNRKNIKSLLARALAAELEVTPADRRRLMNAVRLQKNNACSVRPAILPWGPITALAAACCLLVFFLHPGSFTIGSSRGQVSVSLKNVPLPVRQGIRLRPGTVITTANGAECWIKFGRNVFYCAPRSSLVVSSVRWTPLGDSAILDLASGRFFGNFQDRKSLHRLDIRMKNATACVLGTVFMTVSSNTGDRTESAVAVLQGSIEVCSAGGPRDVNAGEIILLNNRREPSKTALRDESPFSKVLDFALNHSVAGSVKAPGLSGLQTAEDDRFFYFISEDGVILGVDKKTLSPAWRCRIPANVTAPPAVHEGKLYVNSSDGTLSCVSSGKVLWRKKFGPAVYSSPVVCDESLILADTRGMVTSVDLNGSSAAWSSDLKEGVFSTPTVRDGSIYVVTINARVIRLDQETGKIIWSTKLEGRIIDCPVQVLDGALFTAASPGYLYKLAADDGRILQSRRLDEKISGPLLWKNGNLYARTGGLSLFNPDARLMSELDVPEADYLITGNWIIADSGRVAFYGTDGSLKASYTKSRPFRFIPVENRLTTYDGVNFTFWE